MATGALGGKPDPIALREIDSGRVVATLAGHTQRVQGLAFDPAGRVLALTGQDGVVRLWDVATGAMLAALAGHSQFVMDVSFSTDGQLLASVDAAGNVILWNVADRSRVRQSTSADSAHGVAFAPDGRTLYTSGTDGITIWQAPELRKVSEPLRGTTAGAGDLVLSPEGRSVIAADSLRLRFWDVDPGAWRTRASDPAGRNLTEAEWADFINAAEPCRRTCPQYP